MLGVSSYYEVSGAIQCFYMNIPFVRSIENNIKTPAIEQNQIKGVEALFARCSGKKNNR